tara:strand:+ start:2293 stop:2661 length:369 start_codon:yes stop_codon:yes gene_type:complete
MATRKFNGIEYPVPGVDTAIQTLYPGARYDLNNTTFNAWEDDEGRQPPDWKDVEAEIIREVKIYNYYLYERNRQQQYPEIKDQLDMLYHDLKSGNLNNGTWIAAIDAVKENNPKPEGPEPKL